MFAAISINDEGDQDLLGRTEEEKIFIGDA
jgi:hypothetical protein